MRERLDMTAELVTPRANARTMKVRRSILPSRSWSTRCSKREFILLSSMHHTGSIAGYHACYRISESCAPPCILTGALQRTHCPAPTWDLVIGCCGSISQQLGHVNLRREQNWGDGLWVTG